METRDKIIMDPSKLAVYAMLGRDLPGDSAVRALEELESLKAALLDVQDQLQSLREEANQNNERS